MFKKNNPGCASDPTNCGCGGETLPTPCGQFTISAPNCSGMPGGEAATVTVRGPLPATTTVGTGTVAPGATLVVPVYAPGDYTIEGVKPRYADVSETVNHPCDGRPGGQNVNWSLDFSTPADGYVCCGCPDPVPATLNATSKWGAFTLTYDETWPGWLGCQSVTLDGVQDCDDGPCECAATVTTGIFWELLCDAVTNFFQLAGCYDSCGAVTNTLPGETGGACGEGTCSGGSQGFNLTGEETCGPLFQHWTGGAFDDDINLIFTHTDEVVITE